MFPHFQVSIAAKKLGFQIRRVKRAGCMFSAANQTPTAGVENGNKDQIPLHSDDWLKRWVHLIRFSSI